MVPPVEVYIKPWCPFCIRLLALLDRKNVPYKTVDLDDEPQRREEMIRRSGGAKTVPQLFIDDNHIGDCSYVTALEARGELDPLLNRP